MMRRIQRKAKIIESGVSQSELKLKHFCSFEDLADLLNVNLSMASGIPWLC